MDEKCPQGHKIEVVDVNVFERVTWWCKDCQEFYQEWAGQLVVAKLPLSDDKPITAADIPPLPPNDPQA